MLLNLVRKIRVRTIIRLLDFVGVVLDFVYFFNCDRNADGIRYFR